MGRRLPWLHPQLRVPYTVPEPPALETAQRPRDATRNSPDTPSEPSPKPSKLGMRSAARPSGRGRLIQEMSTPSRARQQAPPTSSTPGGSTHRLNGLFSQGTFFCNCNPRRKAKRLTAGKGAKNPGRKFYGCVVSKCGFFLWEDQAIARSGGALASSTQQNDPPAEPPTPTPAPRKVGEEEAIGPAPPAATQLPTPSTRATGSKKTRTQPIQHYFPRAPKPNNDRSADPSSTSEEETPATAEPGGGLQRSAASRATLAASTPSVGDKRKRVSFEEDDYDVSSDEERKMSAIIESSSRKRQAMGPEPETDDATPVTQRVTESVGAAVLPTARRLFIEERPRRPSAASQQQSPANQVGVTEEVMSLLPETLDASVADAVRQALGRHADRLRIAIKGLDSVRTQLAKKDDHIAVLQERVAALENKTKMQREEITAIKAGLANLYSQH